MEIISYIVPAHYIKQKCKTCMILCYVMKCLYSYFDLMRVLNVGKAASIRGWTTCRKKDKQLTNWPLRDLKEILAVSHFQANFSNWRLKYEHMSMAQCKTAVTPLLTHWSYCSLALSHRCNITNKYMYLPSWAESRNMRAPLLPGLDRYMEAHPRDLWLETNTVKACYNMLKILIIDTNMALITPEMPTFNFHNTYWFWNKTNM